MWHLIIVSGPSPIPPVRRHASGGAFPAEAPTGRVAGPGRCPLFGDLHSLGFRFAWHEFALQSDLDWSREFQPGGLGLCLNFEGRATLSDARRTVELQPRTSAFYFQGTPPLAATRRANHPHRFITVEFASEFLQRYLQREAPHLHPCVKAVMESAATASEVSPVEPIRVAFLQLAESLQRCPVFKPAQETWFRCKALELAAQFFFCPPEGALFCTRQQRAACERAGRVREILATRLADPPSLEELGRLVGCSSYYLSRQFSEATGTTIQQYLRQVRLERAAELLRAGRHNVTEAAQEVGYNSLSHFAVAFRETFGCCPGLYPLRTVAQSAPETAGPQRLPPKR